jgi:trans-aconitate methyltransferase
VTHKWQSVWQAHTTNDSETGTGSQLARLLRADGYDTGFGSMSDQAFSSFVATTCASLKIESGDTVFEVGCGAGAFLYPPYTAGVRVGGIDYSESLIAHAREVMPSGQFEVKEATALEVTPTADVVISCGVFLYFASLEYASEVIGRMSSKATRAVAILDIADAARAAEALAVRQAHLGGAAAYAARYAGLDHQAYDRQWIVDELMAAGLTDVRVEDQDIEGYANSRFRFNAFGWVPAQQ